MLWSTCAEPSGFACVTYLLVGVFHELHILFMLHLHILQQHFALFLCQFQGLHLGNNTQEGQTLQVLGKNTAAINVPWCCTCPSSWMMRACKAWSSPGCCFLSLTLCRSPGSAWPLWLCNVTICCWTVVDEVFPWFSCAAAVRTRIKQHP